MTDLHDLSAVELLFGYHEKRFSPSEVIEGLIAHIARWEPHIQALFAYDPEGARQAAKQSTDRWARSAPIGSLDGIPITIKENIATRGTPVPLGSITTKLAPAETDAPPAARVREAGAVIFSKTTMPDYGMLSSGLSSFHPLTRNPWDLRMNPGGSSAGAAAAAAAGYGPLHLGTDIGGSVRLPACWTGLFALKPSLGRVPIDPPYMGRVTGPMTRTVEDSALLMSVLSQPDARDSMSLPHASIHWQSLEASPKGKTIGLMLEFDFGMPLEDTVREAITHAAKLFEQAGAHVVEVKTAMTYDMLAGLDKFWRARSWDDISKLSPDEQTKVLPYIYDWAEAAAHLSAIDVIGGFNATMAMRAASAKLFNGLDYVLSPVSPVVKFPAEFASPLNDPTRPFDHITYTVCWNMSEQPAASINAAYDADGFPIGLQIIGKRFDDLGVLQMAKAFEEMREAQRPWPRVPG